MYQSVKEKINALSTRVVAPVVALTAVGVGSAHADTATAISDAFSLAGTHLSTAVGALIAMVAIVTGVGYIISMLRK